MHFTHGAEASRQLHLSLMCLKRAFGGPLTTGLNFRAVSSDKHHAPLNCHPMQNPDYRKDAKAAHEMRRCWAELMRRKLEAARLSPFDITLLLDTDVFANPFARPANAPRGTTLEHLRARFRSHDVDILFGKEANWYFTADPHAPERGGLPSVDLADMTPGVNGGVIIYRRSERTDRFFGCVGQLMERTQREQPMRPFLDEQGAYNTLLHSHHMRSIQAQLLPRQWNCRTGYSHDARDSKGVDRSFREEGVATAPVPCLLVHAKNLDIEVLRRQCGRGGRAASDTRSAAAGGGGGRRGRSRGGGPVQAKEPAAKHDHERRSHMLRTPRGFAQRSNTS